MHLKELNFNFVCMKNYLLCTVIGFLSCISLNGQSPTSISWDMLADVEYSEQYDKKLDAYWLIPTFGESPKAIHNREVVLMGYFIPFNLDENFYVLSRYPYSNCFFCGGAGPESVVELQFDGGPPAQLRMDKKYFFKGTFKLNADDFDHCNYIFENATVMTQDEVSKIKK